MDDNVELRFDGEYRSLFAARDFRQGEKIIGLPRTTQPLPDKYSIEAWPGIHVDCSQSAVGALNHSCEPNAAVKDTAVIAWSCIKAGDEILIDYRRTENKLAAPFDCNCGAKDCGGRIE